jgi:hypothetical protein
LKLPILRHGNVHWRRFERLLVTQPGCGTLSSATENLKRGCATTPAHYFNAPTNAQLQAVFEADRDGDQRALSLEIAADH